MKTTRSLTLFFALALLGLVFLALSTPTARAISPGILRVMTSGTTAWPCGNVPDWSNACALQTALTNALSGSELWVASGTYTPTTGTDRTATFQLRDGIALYGGFAGSETSRSQRNFATKVTILSGDIGVQGNSSDNAYHVVTGSGVTNTAVLDGFTVTGGRADGSSPNDRGGGMCNDGGSPTVANVSFISNTAAYGAGMVNWFYSSPTLSKVIFSDNVASGIGGGMYNSWFSSPTLTNVTFSRNSATLGSGGMSNWYNSSPTLSNVILSDNFVGDSGGGMENVSDSNPTLTNVTFIGNTAPAGGGMLNYDNSNPTLDNVTFSRNSATLAGGGGMFNYDSSPTLTNTTFFNNTAADYGGGMLNRSSNPTLTNVTFSGNSATLAGGGMYNYFDYSNPTVRNAIFWGNTAANGAQIYTDPVYPASIASIYDSVVQDGYTGGTHIVIDDPRLGPIGNWGGSTQTVPLLAASSAIDAGDDAHCPATDQRGVTRPVGLHCDMGAFEGVLYLGHLPLIRK